MVKKVAEKTEFKDIEVLAQKVKSNSERVNKQRQDISDKIKELRKDLGSSTSIPGEFIDSFSIEDIENSVKPKESRPEIFKKIAALTRALELPAYADKEYLESIYEYLQSVKPRIEELEKEQWQLVALREEKKREAERYQQEILDKYFHCDKEIRQLLEIADIKPNTKSYNKFTSTNEVAKLIDAVLQRKDGKFFSTMRNI
ncbi:hypothetical protein [Clostridium sp.]|uniref:hypothetical protein n=1 Tax=Clostridium sp. TaxID=1506 RepID=UPI00359FEDED